jgi:FkbM family methyltransferase
VPKFTRTPAELDAVLLRIQCESFEAVHIREASAFDQIAGSFATQLVLFGAGPLGKSTLDGLRRLGVEPLAFADNNAQLWGKEISGLVVLSPQEAASRYSHSACFVVTIYNGSAARCQLGELGCKKIAPLPLLFWKYSEIFTPTRGIDLPHRLHDALDEIVACDSILYDNASRRELLEQVRWRYWLDYGVLSAALDGKHTYFPFDLVAPMENEVFVDCGSFDGDSLRSFASHWNGRFRHAFAFEPDPANRAALAVTIDKMQLGQRATIMPYAVGDRSGPVSFICSSSAASHVAPNGSNSTVESRTLDDIAWPLVPTYVKMDIEGGEPEALRGGAKTLRRYGPVLAICTYHRSEHLWQIPNLIHSILPEYRIFLRRYAEECWEGVCYAIPPNRLRSA